MPSLNHHVIGATPASSVAKFLNNASLISRSPQPPHVGHSSMTCATAVFPAGPWIVTYLKHCGEGYDVPSALNWPEFMATMYCGS